MAKTYTKKEAVAIAISASRMYRDNFVGKRLLFLLSDKHKRVSSLEVGFYASNYHHLTGLELVDESLSHQDFYKLCVEGRLKQEDIRFHANGTSHQKLSVLQLAFKNTNLSANAVGTYNNLHPLLYTEKVVGSVKWALGFRANEHGNYVPDTLLEGDIYNVINESYRILATYEKNVDEDDFARIIYRAKKIEYDKLSYPDDWGNRPRITPPVAENIAPADATSDESCKDKEETPEQQ